MNGLLAFVLLELSLLALAGWCLWKALPENPSEYERQADELRVAVRQLEDQLSAALRPPLERLNRRLDRWLSRWLS